MKTYNQKRGSGKTTRLLILSDYTGIPIVVPSMFQKKLLEQKKEVVNCPNAQIEVIDKIRGKSKEVFVDEGYSLLKELLMRDYGVSVAAATDTIPFWGKESDDTEALLGQLDRPLGQ